MKCRGMVAFAAMMGLFFGGCVTDAAVNQLPAEAGVEDAQRESDASVSMDARQEPPTRRDASRPTVDGLVLDPDGSMVWDASTGSDVQVEPEVDATVDARVVLDASKPELDAQQVDARVPFPDSDEDGTPDAIDCDPRDPQRYIGAPERCNGLDDDCDRLIDEDVMDAEVFYRDQDGDDQGDLNQFEMACERPVGFVQNSFDCDDTRADVFTGALEVCDFVDNNCDGFTDEGVLGIYFIDADQDTFGDLFGQPVTGCVTPLGYANNHGDCQDLDPAINPSATEVCDENNTDENCSNAADDEDELVDVSTFQILHEDLDGDGYGNPNQLVLRCDLSVNAVFNATDCDDTRASTHPTAPETCNMVDDDCDGELDEDAVDPMTWFLDGDGDGYGDANVFLVVCNQPEGYVVRDTDCNDRFALMFPGASELCNNLDDDCDGWTDEDAVDQNVWYADADGDGFGNTLIQMWSCVMPDGFSANDLDCNDLLLFVNPEAPETCNTVDDDCDGEVDEDSVDALVWYQDLDEDQTGNPFVVRFSCTQPVGYVAVAGDCDDRNNRDRSSSVEICDGIDNDCDGEVDEGERFATYADVDGDTYGDSQTEQFGCTIPVGRTTKAGDCDDANPSINPEAREICDGDVDNDCNGLADDLDPSVSAGSLSTYHRDADGDGYGNPNDRAMACDAPLGYVADQSDCDDGRMSIHPGSVETCNGLDDDCDGFMDEEVLLTWYADRDGDKCPEGSMDGEVVDVLFACERPEGYIHAGSPEIVCGMDAQDPRLDCNDENSDVNPMVSETCNMVDDDCDGEVDEQAVDAPVWYENLDRDNAGNPLVTLRSCVQPFGYLSVPGDCNDHRDDIQSGGEEVCDGQDNDCDGLIDEGVLNPSYADDDMDGYGDVLTEQWTCLVSAERVVRTGDCNDADPLVGPRARELCDGIDNNCDGQIDEGLMQQSYADQDQDSFGDPNMGMLSCVVPEGNVRNNLDCNDANANVNPRVLEVCDEFDVDENCNRLSDDADPTVSVRTLSRFAPDVDGDGFGDRQLMVLACNAPAATVNDVSDCNDRLDYVHLGAPERENGIDDDCDGSVDELTNVTDDDRDGYSENQGDCNDASPTTYPNQRAEVCDGMDNDCDGIVDDLIGTNVFPDADADGHGAMVASNVWVCGAVPARMSAMRDDCNDNSNQVFPGALELCNLMDDNCDGTLDEGVTIRKCQDADRDGFGSSREPCVSGCAEVGFVGSDTDCDDHNDTIHPNAKEVCDGRDNDCDALTDAADPSVDLRDTLYAFVDADADRWGDTDRMVVWCSQEMMPEGLAWNDGDCNNNDPSVHPQAVEICGSVVDHNCDEMPGNEGPCVDEGSYEGPFALRVNDPVFGHPSGACTGTVSLAFSLDQLHPVMGRVTCTYDGDFLGPYPGDQTGTIEAEVFDDLFVWGSLKLEPWDWTFYFSGTFVESNEVRVEFDSSQNELNGHLFNTSGEFSATRLVP